MYVCVCKAVTDTEVDGAIEAGALSVAEVTRACRAGGDCGACHAMIDRMIEGRCDRAYTAPSPGHSLGHAASQAPSSDRAAAQSQTRRLALLRSHAA
jgi:bacterioferritin-associated ferredoxin